VINVLPLVFGLHRARAVCQHHKHVPPEATGEEASCVPYPSLT